MIKQIRYRFYQSSRGSGHNYHIIQRLSSIRRGGFDKRLWLWFQGGGRPRPSVRFRNGSLCWFPAREPIRSTSLPFPSGSEDTMRGNRTFARRAYWISREDITRELFQHIRVILNEGKKLYLLFISYPNASRRRDNARLCNESTVFNFLFRYFVLFLRFAVLLSVRFLVRWRRCHMIRNSVL